MRTSGDSRSNNSHFSTLETDTNLARFGNDLVDWLNGEDRVTEAMLDLTYEHCEFKQERTELAGEAEAARQRVRREILPVFLAVQRGGDCRRYPGPSPLERIMSRYVRLPSYKAPNHFSIRSDGEPLVALAAHILLALRYENQLARVIECEAGCGRLVLKSRQNHRFCSDRCRVRTQQSDPAWRTHRNQVARDDRAARRVLAKR